MKRVVEILGWLTAIALFAFASHAVFATGKVTAFDGNAAAPKLARRIVGEMRKARGETETKRKK